MKKVYLIHGTSTRDDDWFAWWLPEPFNPDVQAWDRAIDDQITKDDDLTIVAHSLGCIAALRFIQRQSLHNVRLILVGGRSHSHYLVIQN